jgi:hypothetical protein
MDHPEGANIKRADRAISTARVRLEFRGTQLSSDGGLLVMRELDDALGLSDLALAALRDSRTGKNASIGLTGCSGNRSMDGWRATRTSTTPTDWLLIPSCARSSVAVPSMRRRPRPRRWGGSRPRRWPWTENREALADLNGQWIDRFHDRNGAEVYRAGHGQLGQPDPWRSGRCRLERAFRLHLLPPELSVQSVRYAGTLRPAPGNVHSADGWRDVLDPVIARYAKRDIMRLLPG